MAVTATQIEFASARGDVPTFFALLPRHAWLCGLVARSAVEPALVDVPQRVSDLSSPDDWELECSAARAATAGLLGMLVLDGMLEGAIVAAKRACDVSPALAGLLPEFYRRAHQRTNPSVGIASLRRLMTNEPANAEQLLQASTACFIWLKFSAVRRLDQGVFAILRERWLDLVRNRRAVLSNPRIAVPEIEAAAELAPSIVAIARLVEAVEFSSARTLPRWVQELLRRTV